MEYEELKVQEKEIKEKSAELKKEIEEVFPENDEFITPTGGALVWKERPNYIFSKETQTKEDDLKEIKKVEIQEGIAENVPSRFVEYRHPKK